MRLLLVEDDRELGQGLTQGLKLGGHAVDWLDSGTQARAALDYDTFEVVILDLGLPGASGLELITAWRGEGHDIPILVLTADDTNAVCCEALNAGADDFITKPAPLDQIEARLNALARRASGRAHNRLVWGGLSIERGTNIIELDGQALTISAYERSVLEALLERPGHVVAREHLEERLYGWRDGPESNSLEVLIHKLRSKVGRSVIETVRGLGWRLAK